MSRWPRTREDGIPTVGEVVYVLFNVLLVFAIFFCIYSGVNHLFGKTDNTKAETKEESTYKPTHDSLQISYTYDKDKQVRWYVFVDPDTHQEYLFNDLGGVTPRLGADGVSVMRTTFPSNDEP